MSGGFIESNLSSEASNLHRALASLEEEVEAIDFYHQRADASDDETLKAVLIHNRNDEMEHAAMLLEWLRRAMPEFDAQMRKFMFTTGPITAPSPGATPSTGSGLGLGKLN